MHSSQVFESLHFLQLDKQGLHTPFSLKKFSGQVATQAPLNKAFGLLHKIQVLATTSVHFKQFLSLQLKQLLLIETVFGGQLSVQFLPFREYFGIQSMHSTSLLQLLHGDLQSKHTPFEG